jgi:hypothetical protein
MSLHAWEVDLQKCLTMHVMAPSIRELCITLQIIFSQAENMRVSMYEPPQSIRPANANQLAALQYCIPEPITFSKVAWQVGL